MYNAKELRFETKSWKTEVQEQDSEPVITIQKHEAYKYKTSKYENSWPLTPF